MKKVIGIFFDILSIACLIGGYIIQYYTKRKLGMLRWVVYQEAKWQERLPLDILKYVYIILLILLVVGLCKLFGGKIKENVISICLMVVMTVIYICACIFMTNEVVRSSFLIITLIGIGAFIQIIKCMIVICICKNN